MRHKIISQQCKCNHSRRAFRRQSPQATAATPLVDGVTVTPTKARNSALKDVADIASAYVKWGTVLAGGLCLFVYTREIGQFPEGVNVGEGLAFYLLSAGFLLVYSLYVAITTSIGCLLFALPAVCIYRMTRKRAMKRIPPPGREVIDPSDALPIDLSLMWAFPVWVLALCGFLAWWSRAYNNPLLAAQSLVFALLQGVLVAVWLGKRRKNTYLQTRQVAENENDEVSKKERAANVSQQRWILVAIMFVPLLTGSPQQEFFIHAAFRAAQLRKDSAVVQVKLPWAARVQASTLVRGKSFLGENYVEFRDVKVLLRSVGTRVVIELPQDRKPAAKLSIPSDAIYVE